MLLQYINLSIRTSCSGQDVAKLCIIRTVGVPLLGCLFLQPCLIAAAVISVIISCIPGSSTGEHQHQKPAVPLAAAASQAVAAHHDQHQQARGVMLTHSTQQLLILRAFNDSSGCTFVPAAVICSRIGKCCQRSSTDSRSSLKAACTTSSQSLRSLLVVRRIHHGKLA